MLLLLILAVSCLVTCTMDGRYCSYEREDGNTMQGLRTVCSSLCYCFPQQVEVNKSCQDVDEEDFMMRPNELMKVLCIRPPRTPAMTPEETPAMTPEETPAMTPPRTPEKTPNQTPHETPDLTPYQTPYQSPHQTPDLTPYQTPYQSPYQTPYETPDLTPYQTCSATPNATIFKTEEPSISFMIIQEQPDRFFQYLYIGLSLFAFWIIITIIIICCCCKKKKQIESTTESSSPEIIQLWHENQFPATITVNEDSDPFAEDFVVSDDYFDAMDQD